MKQLRVIIADDERPSREELRTQLEAIENLLVVAECADGAAALTAIKQDEPHIVFLDIEMPRLSGFEVLKRLEPPLRPVVVFVTAYDEHALRAFEVDAVDYVLKPFDEQRVSAAVERARTRCSEHELSGQMKDILQNAVAQRGQGDLHARRILVPQGGRRAFFVPTSDIDWIEALDNHIRLHVRQQAHLVRMTITELEQKLDPAEFMRIHRSTIVNLNRIQHVEPYGGSDYQVVLADGRKLRVSRSYRSRLLQSGS